MSEATSIDVGEVISVVDGYGFSVVNEDRRPVVTFSYANEKDAKEARVLIAESIAKAVSVEASDRVRAARKA